MVARSSGDVQIKNSYLHRINQLKSSEGVRAMLTTLCSIVPIIRDQFYSSGEA